MSRFIESTCVHGVHSSRKQKFKLAMVAKAFPLTRVEIEYATISSHRDEQKKKKKRKKQKQKKKKLSGEVENY